MQKAVIGWEREREKKKTAGAKPEGTARKPTDASGSDPPSIYESSR
jgi:hypothetical protein